MIAVLDSTVLIAALAARHPLHAPCRRWLIAASTPGAYRCTTHALAETFRVLVALPVAPRHDAAAIRQAIRTNLIPRLDPIALTTNDYDRAMDAVCASPLGPGAIYDALHLVAADRIQATALITSNHRHFAALATALGTSVAIRDPADEHLTHMV